MGPPLPMTRINENYGIKSINQIRKSFHFQIHSSNKSAYTIRSQNTVTQFSGYTINQISNLPVSSQYRSRQTRGNCGNGGVFPFNTQETGNDHCMFPLWSCCFSSWGAPFLCQC